RVAQEVIERLAADRGLPAAGGAGCLNLVLFIGGVSLEPGPSSLALSERMIGSRACSARKLALR
ncbi:MAG TPA: hypothetical protein VJY33_02585, partial [Isosphaeraceae bacterium]|nr:hypothetical protein [Isosphaeraceae bacterium]